MLLLAFEFINLLISCTDNPNDPGVNNVYTIPEQINDGWETASLSSVGLSEYKLLQMLGYLRAILITRFTV
jgi:hypothetical protein